MFDHYVLVVKTQLGVIETSHRTVVLSLILLRFLEFYAEVARSVGKWGRRLLSLRAAFNPRRRATLGFPLPHPSPARTLPPSTGGKRAADMHHPQFVSTIRSARHAHVLSPRRLRLPVLRAAEHLPEQ